MAEQNQIIFGVAGSSNRREYMAIGARPHIQECKEACARKPAPKPIIDSGNPHVTGPDVIR